MIVFFETSIPDLAKSLVSDLAVDSSDTSFIGFFSVFEIFSHLWQACSLLCDSQNLAEVFILWVSFYLILKALSIKKLNNIITWQWFAFWVVFGGEIILLWCTKRNNLCFLKKTGVFRNSMLKIPHSSIIMGMILLDWRDGTEYIARVWILSELMWASTHCHLIHNL